MENIATNYDVLCDKMFRLTAQRLLIKCGVRAELKGFGPLADAVILFGTGELDSMSDIYKAVAEHRGRNIKSLVREMSYAVHQSLGICEKLSRLVGIDLAPCDIHNGLVIAYLGIAFRAPDSGIY